MPGAAFAWRTWIRSDVGTDILGHEKPRVTHGAYSGGASLAQKRDAINKLSYPELWLPRNDR